ncbi:TlpA family protein disulfide reductase [Paraflavitalea soli]|nr:TlpA disulfide reductase family protein [Paraflavitalea soli]
MKYMSLLVMAGMAMSTSLAQSPIPKPVTITVSMAHITDSTPTVFTFHFVNPFYKESPQVQLDANGRLLVRGEMIFTQNMTVRYNEVFINLYVSPGDSVHLSIDAALLADKHFGWLSISGDHAQLSEQLNKSHQYIMGLPYKKYDLHVPAPDMLAAFRADYAEKMATFNTYAAVHQLHPVVIDFIQRDYLYGLSNWITDYVMDSLPEAERKARINIFRDSIFELHEPANFKSMMFSYHLGWYAKWIAESNGAVRTALREERWKDAIEAAAASLLQEPAGINRDYMFFSFLSGIVAKSPTLLEELPAIRHYFTAPLYYDYFTRSVKRNASLSFSPLAVSGLHKLTASGQVQRIPPTDVLQFLGKRYRGKVIYLDVYATWCGPCRKEMTYTPALHQAYKKQQVEFVNLCAQDEMPDWKKLIKEKNLPGEHYFLDADASKLFLGNYRITGFPTYWLIDKKGKIVTKLAPRPSDSGKLHQQLDVLLAGQ